MNYKQLADLVTTNYLNGNKSHREIHDYLGALDVIKLSIKYNEYYSQILQKELYSNCIQQKEGLLHALRGTNIYIENISSHDENICKYRIINCK